MMATLHRLNALPLVVFLAAIGMAVASPAQNLLEQLTDPDAKRPTIDESVGGHWDFSRSAKNRNDRYRGWGMGISLAAPIPIFGISGQGGGGRLADPSEQNPGAAPGDADSGQSSAAPGPGSGSGIEGGMLLLPNYSYTALRNDRDTLPRRIVSAGGSAFGFAGFEATERKIRFGAFARWGLNSDMEDTHLSDGQYTAAAFALVPASDDWYFTPGIGYISDFALTFLEGIPLPSVEVIYAPRKSSFLAAFGLPFNFVQYRPVPWLTLFAISFAGPYGQLAVSQQVTENFVLRQSFGTASNVVNLTDPKYPKDTRLFERSMYLNASVEFKLPRLLSVSLGWDYNFQHRYWIESPRVAEDLERLDLHNGSTVSLNVTVKF